MVVHEVLGKLLSMRALVACAGNMAVELSENSLRNLIFKDMRRFEGIVPTLIPYLLPPIFLLFIDVHLQRR